MFVLPDSIQFNRNLSISLRDFIRALAHHCGGKAACWPSQQTIADFMGRSTRTVKRMERLAVELKLIEVKRCWLKPNIYRVLCMEERKLSPMGTQGCPVEQRNLKTQRLTAKVQGSWKSPAEIKILIEDMGDVFGEEVTERNRGWLWRIAQAVEDSWIYEALSWISESIEIGESTGDYIKAPCALFTWRLRAMGAPI